MISGRFEFSSSDNLKIVCQDDVRLENSYAKNNIANVASGSAGFQWFTVFAIPLHLGTGAKIKWNNVQYIGAPESSPVFNESMHRCYENLWRKLSIILLIDGLYLAVMQHRFAYSHGAKWRTGSHTINSMVADGAANLLAAQIKLQSRH